MCRRNRPPLGKTLSVDVSLGRLAESSELGARWLVEHRREDGFPLTTKVGLQSCYRMVWALGLHGYTAEAHTLGRNLECWLDTKGDLPGRWQSRLERHYLYPNAYLVLGAQTIGLDSLARPLYRFLRSRRDPGTGGFYSQPPVATGSLSMDTASTSIAGLAAIAMGELPVAEGAVGFLRHTLERQPEPTIAFYTGVAASDGELVTQVSPSDRSRRIGVRKRNEAWYFLGLPALFLSALHGATNEESQLTLALRYLEYLAVDCHDEAFTAPSSGKSGVGAAHLYRLTGDPRLREVALEVADSILRWQDPSGCWLWEPSQSSPTSALEPADVDLTSEHVIWLHQIRAHLEQ